MKSPFPWTASQVALVVKNPPANAGDIRDAGSTPGPGRSLGGGHGNPLQSSWLENPTDRGAWRAAVGSHSQTARATNPCTAKQLRVLLAVHKCDKLFGFR